MTSSASTTGIPGTDKIFSEALSLVAKSGQEKLKPAYVERNFSEVCELLFYESYSIYQKYEKKALEDMSDNILKRYGKETYTQNEVKKILREATMEASLLEKSLKQSRASRAGKAFELIVSNLLQTMGIPHEKVTKEDKKTGLRLIDMVIPDTKTAIRDPDQAKFLSLKTSLKDRWKLAVEDQRQGQRTYLLTLLQSEKLTKEVAEKIVDAGIILYVPDEIKDKQFPNKSGIRKLSDLPKNLR
jgi:hypothetical protein